MPSEVQLLTEALHASMYVQLTLSLLLNLPFPLNFPGRCFNTYKSSNSHKSFFYHFLFKCFSQPHIFTKLVGAIITARPSAPPFGSAPISHQLFGKAHAQAKYRHSCLISLGNQTTNVQLLLFLCRTKPTATIPKQQTTVHHCADISAG